VPDELYELLTSLLVFNPKKRFSAEKVLMSSYFDDIRIPQLEKNAPYEIFLGVDQIDET
jgi:hypothetical protein